MKIKKATRLPEQVEYFVWDGENSTPKDWGYIFDFDEDGSLYIKQGVLDEVEKGSYVVKHTNCEVRSYTPAEFEANFLHKEGE